MDLRSKTRKVAGCPCLAVLARHGSKDWDLGTRPLSYPRIRMMSALESWCLLLLAFHLASISLYLLPVG